jgi:anion-transporting  ArsA/GET3 family ATPase
MDLRRFCSRSRVVIVAGKGGVGKTTVTAALAVAATRAGLSVLIAEVEGTSSLPAAFGRRQPLRYEATELAPGIAARALAPDDALIDYLETHGMRRISKRLVASGALDVVATAVPGMKDILVLGKVKSLEQDRVADLIIVDAPAAGHAITFLLAARALIDAVRVGPVRKQALDVAAMLGDPERCEVLLVTLPEATPVRELVDTAFAVEDRAGVALGPVIVNACVRPLPAAVPASPRELVDEAQSHERFLSEREAGDLTAAAQFHERRFEQQEEQLAVLAEELPLPQLLLPFVFSASLGPDEIDTLADALVAGIEAL